MISMYILFSKLGIASVNGITIYTFVYMLIVGIITILAVVFIKRKDLKKTKKNEAKVDLNQ